MGDNGQHCISFVVGVSGSPMASGVDGAREDARFGGVKGPSSSSKSNCVNRSTW